MKKLLFLMALLLSGMAHADEWFYVNTDLSFDKRDCIPVKSDPALSSLEKFGRGNFDGRYIDIADGSRVYAVFWHTPAGRVRHLAFASSRKTCYAILEPTTLIVAGLAK